MNLVLCYVNNLCCPREHIYKDPSERELAFRCNRSSLIIFASIALGMLFYILLVNGSYSVQKGYIFVPLLMTVISLALCRAYPKIANVLFFIIITSFGPLIHYTFKDSVFFNTIGVVIIPTWTLLTSGNKAFFALQLIIQNIYLHVLYKPQIALVIEEMLPEDYSIRVSNIVSVSTFINAIFVVVEAVPFEKVHYHIMEVQNKKIQLERQKTFILSFSHELRNVINSMLGNLRLSMMETFPSSKEALLNTCEVCGEVLLQLVNNILDTGKIEVGELEINPRFNKSFDVWDKTWRICSQLIKNKRLYGQFRIHKKIPSIIKIDSYRLLQVFLNLVGNAIKFTDSGSITIDLQWIDNMEQVTEKCFHPRPFSNEDEDAGLFEKSQDFALFDGDFIAFGVNSKVSASVEKDNRSRSKNPGILKIIVTDTGCGVSPENLPLLFQKFAQVHDDPSKRTLGTGLGLFITKELVQKMNGDIKVFSQVKKGTVFIVCIPVYPGQENE